MQPATHVHKGTVLGEKCQGSGREIGMRRSASAEKLHGGVPAGRVACGGGLLHVRRVLFLKASFPTAAVGRSDARSDSLRK